MLAKNHKKASKSFKNVTQFRYLGDIKYEFTKKQIKLREHLLSFISEFTE